MLEPVAADLSPDVFIQVYCYCAHCVHRVVWLCLLMEDSIFVENVMLADTSPSFDSCWTHISLPVFQCKAAWTLLSLSGCCFFGSRCTSVNSAAFCWTNSVRLSVRDKSEHCKTVSDRPMVTMGACGKSPPGYSVDLSPTPTTTHSPKLGGHINPS